MKENFILVMCDDLGYGDVGFNGNKIIKTPHLDQLAKEGAVFNNFHSGAPVCSPTRGTCLTGRHYHRYTVTCANAGYLPKEEITIQQLLKTQGYTTGHFGKWHLGTVSRTIPDGRRGGEKNAHLYSPPWERDFDTCFSCEAQMPLFNPMDNQAVPAKYWTAEHKYVTENLEGDDSKVIMDRAIPFIENAVSTDTPFFSVIWFHTPHEPVVASPEHRAMYSEYPENMQHYFGCITAMDEQVGRLNQKLKDLGIEDNTCIWFCSDNGPESGHDTSVGTTSGLRGRKRSLFNGGVTVPALIKWKKHVKEGSVYNFLASTLDFLPTFIAENCIKMPDSRPIDGADLLDYFAERKIKREKPIPFRYVNRENAMFGSPTYALVCEDYKILFNPNSDENNMMFNTLGDRREEFNVLSSQQEIFDKYKKYLTELAESFERSHNGHDYDVSDYSPILDYVSNDLSSK